MTAQPATRSAGGVAALGCGLAGLAGVPAAAMLAETRPSFLLAGLAGLAVLAAILLVGWLKPALLIGYVLLLTYNRQYYTFAWLHGDLGARGLYWGLADLCLVALFLVWLVESALRNGTREFRRTGLGSAPWLLPFVGLAALSAAAAAEPVGSAVEVLRYAKMVLLLVYLRYNLTAYDRPVLIAGLAGVILLQAPIAALQVIFASGQNGISQIFQTGEPSDLARRAAGTLGHPNYLGAYMLLLTPPFLAVAIGLVPPSAAIVAHRARPARTSPERDRLLRRWSACIAAAGAFTIVLTQSRGPILLLLASTLMLIAMLTWRRAMSPLRALALLVAGAGFLIAAVIPLAPAIEKRLTGDFLASVDFRTAYNDAAIRMWESSPALGVGPNNFGMQIRDFMPGQNIVTTLDQLTSDENRNKAYLRTIAPVHNVYLAILSEMGLFGLIGFLIFMIRPVVLAWQASTGPCTPSALFALGLLCGLLAEYVQQQIDYSMLSDALLPTFVLVAGLLQSMVDDRRSMP